jgi:hypothetical protein
MYYLVASYFTATQGQCLEPLMNNRGVWLCIACKCLYLLESKLSLVRPLALPPRRAGHDEIQPSSPFVEPP